MKRWAAITVLLYLAAALSLAVPLFLDCFSWGHNAKGLDDALGLTEMAGHVLADSRNGRNGRHTLTAQFRQSVFGRLRSGNGHSADDWKSVRGPVVGRYRDKTKRRFLRGDAAFALPDLYN